MVPPLTIPPLTENPYSPNLGVEIHPPNLGGGGGESSNNTSFTVFSGEHPLNVRG